MNHMTEGGALISMSALLQDGLGHLEDKLQEANLALQELLKNKARLEQNIKVKANSLLIDKQKCMALRRHFPYNVVSTRFY